MRLRLSFWKNSLLPYCTGAVVAIVGAVCFKVHESTHSPLVAVPVLLLLAFFTSFHVYMWMLRSSLRDAHRKHMKNMFAVASAPEAESTDPIVGSYSFNGLIVPLTEDETKQMDEWVQTMPSSVAAKFDVAQRLAHIID